MQSQILISLISDLLEEEAGISAGIRQMVPMTGGSINASFRIESSAGLFFIKINKADRFPGMFETEAAGLRLLKEVNALRIPDIIMQTEKEGLQFLVLEYIERGNRKNDFFKNFACALAKQHRSTNDYFGLNTSNWIGSLPQSNVLHNSLVDFFREQRLEPQRQLARTTKLLDPSLDKDFDHLYSRLQHLIPDEKPALLHGDLWNGNFLTDSNGDACLIDPAVHYGCRESDLAMASLFGGFENNFYDDYHESFPMETGWKERLAIWNLYPLMVHANLFGPGYLSDVKTILNQFR